ncbi:MAG: hypothetical protein C0513_07620 [Isosphaera sp.]|nr:hypothetical protein [Isosphaera sp.]
MDTRHARAHTSTLVRCAAALTAGLIAGACATGGGGGAAQRDAEIRQERAQEWVSAADEATRRGETRRAIDLLTRAIETNPLLSSAHLKLGDIYRLDGDFGSAERAYGQAARLTPRDFDAQYNHGLMLHALARLADAIGAYLRALQVRPDDFQTNLNLSVAYYQLAEYAEAGPYAERSVRLSPADGSARFNLGLIYAAQGRHDAAVVELQQATESLPLNRRLLLALGGSLGRLERWAEARNVLETLTRQEPAPDAHERLGFALWQLGEYAAAEDQFRAAVALDERYFPAINGLAITALNKWHWSQEDGRPDPASRQRGVDLLRRSIQVNPDQPAVIDLLARYR